MRNLWFRKRQNEDKIHMYAREWLIHSSCRARDYQLAVQLAFKQQNIKIYQIIIMNEIY